MSSSRASSLSLGFDRNTTISSTSASASVYSRNHSPFCSSSSSHNPTIEELRTNHTPRNSQETPLSILSRSSSHSSLKPQQLNLDPLIPSSSRSQSLQTPQDTRNSPSTVPGRTPTPTTQISITPTPAKSSKSKVLPRLNDEETEEEYLVRLAEKVQRSKIPSILAASNQPFHLSALTKFMGSFEFSHDPIDLSIRKLLMAVDLPPETQQIDRVIECFAKRYTACNPKLFKDPDQVYVLAFSIIMLHTDAFNRSNKGKMSRADYVKNTRMDGITIELLEYIYDNVTYTPFIYVESNEQESSRSSALLHQPSHDQTSFFILGGPSSINGIPPSPRIPSAPNNFKVRLDPYQWISQGWTHELRLDLGSVIPSRSPFSFTGSVSWFDFKRLKDSFNPKKSVMIQIVNQTPSKPNSIFKQIESEDIIDSSPLALSLHPLSKQADDPTITIPHDPAEQHSPSSRIQHPSSDAFLNLRAVKVGLVHLKIDLPFSISNQSHHPHSHAHIVNESNLNRNVITKKWKLFCVLLSAGQLILIKDFGLIGELQQSIKLAGTKNQSNPDDQLVVRITGLKPDLVLSLDGAIALVDSTYKRRPCTFRLILSKNLSILMGLNDNDEMDSWITHINYAAAHKTYRIPFWSLGDHHHSSSRPVSTIPSTPTKHPYHHQTQAVGQADSKDRRSFESLLGITKSARTSSDRPPPSRSASISNVLSRSQDPRPASSVPMNNSGSNNTNDYPKSPARLSTVSSSIPTQYDIVRATIMNIEAQIHISKKELNEDLRLARNLAVLTPFQLSTRSRLHQAIMPIADRVRSSRCLLSKLVCSREIFIRDAPITQPSSVSSPSNRLSNPSAQMSRTSLENEGKDLTTTSRSSDTHTSVVATPSPLRTASLRHHQSPGGSILRNSDHADSAAGGQRIDRKSRRASLGECFPRLSSISTHAPITPIKLDRRSSNEGSSKKSIESNEPIDQKPRRLSGSLFMSFAVSAAKSRLSPSPTTRSPEVSEIPSRASASNLMIANDPSSLSGAAVMEPVPGRSGPEESDGGARNLEEDEEVIQNTALRKVGRHQYEDFIDFRDSLEEASDRPTQWSRTSTSASVSFMGSHRTRSSTAMRTQSRSLFSNEPHKLAGMDARQKTAGGEERASSPMRAGGTRAWHASRTSQSLSKSLSRFPRAFLAKRSAQTGEGKPKPTKTRSQGAWGSASEQEMEGWREGGRRAAGRASSPATLTIKPADEQELLRPASAASTARPRLSIKPSRAALDPARHPFHSAPRPPSDPLCAHLPLPNLARSSDLSLHQRFVNAWGLP